MYARYGMNMVESMVIPDHMWHAARAAAEGAGESAPDNADDIVPEIGDWRAFKSRLLASSGDLVHVPCIGSLTSHAAHV